MGKTFVILFIIFLVVSVMFVIQFSKDPKQEVIGSLQTYSATECPEGFVLYRLQGDEHVYDVQIQNKLTENEMEKKLIFRKCEVQISENLPCDQAKSKAGKGYELLDKGTEYWLKEVCDKTTSELKKSEYETTDHVHNNSVLAHLLHVVKGPSLPEVPEMSKPEQWSNLTVMSGIFPGTLWCGFGNIADDVYSQTGDHPDTDNCCRTHDLCKPIIRAFETRYFYSNPSILPISHCSCDQDFYNCLLRVNSPTSKTIGKIFFNLVKMKCFDFDVQEVCVSSILGLCRERKEKCVAVLKSNNPYPV